MRCFKPIRKFRHRGRCSVGAKKGNGVLHATKVYPGIEAWAKRTLVRDAKDRHGKRVGQAAREVALTGNGDNRLRTNVFHDPSGKSAARCDEKINAQFIGDLDKVLDLAASASFTIMDIVGNPDCAFIELKAMGKEEENFLRLRPLGTDEPVVQVDHDALKILAGSLCKGADEHEKGIQNLQDDSPQELISFFQKRLLPSAAVPEQMHRRS